MFTLTHYIWIGICVITILILFILNRKFKFSFNTNLTILFCMTIVSESIKILSGMEPRVDPITNEVIGTYLKAENLPFHLCSIQVFFIFFLKFIIKDEKKQDFLLSFMVPTMLFGGLLAILIPNSGTDFRILQTYEYFGFHAFIIYFALYLLISKRVVLTGKIFIKNISFLLILMVFGIWINSILADKGVNFFFLANPPMPDQHLPILNTDNGWGWYFVTLVSIGLIIMTLFHLPFIIINHKKLNSNKKAI